MASAGDGDSNTLSLNLTPMLDIFSILVTFLLMSYSTDPINHDLDPDMELPASGTIVNLDEIPTVTVTKNKIIINDKKVADVINGDVPEKDRTQGAIAPVFKALDKISEQNKKVFKKLGKEEQKKMQSLTMEMDENHRFKLLKRVMISAEQAEFTKFKLVVAKDE